MNIVLKWVFGSLAVLIVVGSSSFKEALPPGDRTTPMVLALLVFLSVAFLHWLLARYATATDLLSAEQRGELLQAGQAVYQRGFFAQTNGVGFLLVFLYATSVAGYPLGIPVTTPYGTLLLGIVFLFLGLAARMRGVVVNLVTVRRDSASQVQPNPPLIA